MLRSYGCNNQAWVSTEIVKNINNDTHLIRAYYVPGLGPHAFSYSSVNLYSLSRSEYHCYRTRKRPSLGHVLKDTQTQDSNPDLHGSKPQPDHYSTWHILNLSEGEDIKVDLQKLILKPWECIWSLLFDMFSYQSRSASGGRILGS